MRVAVVVDAFPSISETFVLSHVTGLVDRGVDVRIFAWALGDLGVQHADVSRYDLLSRLSILTPPDGKLARLASGAKLVLGQPPTRVLLRALNVPRFGMEAASLRLLHQVARLVGGYDIVHCHFGPNGERMARLKALGVPGRLVTTFHGYDIRMGLAHGPTIYRTLFAEADALVAISPYNRRCLLELGADAARIVDMPLGVDVGLQPPSVPRTSAGAPLRLVSVARLSPEKGLRHSLEAVAELRRLRPDIDVRYEVVGEGPDRGALESLIGTLGLGPHVVLLGARGQDEVRAALSRAHMFVLPSLAEALPMCLMEALGAGLATVATAVGSVDRIVIDGRTGVLVPPGRADAIASQLVRLVDNPAEAAALGHAGREHVRHNFDRSHHFDALLHLYRSLLN